MLKKFEINSIHADVDERLRKYATRKLGNLDKYVPKNSRDSAHEEVHLKELKTSNKNNSRCEVTLYLPHQTIVIKESALNMYAAIDIVEAKLKLQLKKYKDTHDKARMRRHLIGRFIKKSS